MLHFSAIFSRKWSLLAALALVALATACGPITEDDLQKWSQNEEGLKRITEIMQDPDVPFHVQTKAIVILVDNGWANRIRGIVGRHTKADDLSTAVGVELVKVLESQSEDSAHRARDGLFQLMARMSDEQRDAAQKALAEWAFTGATHDKSREEIWELISPRIAMPQVRDLAEYGVTPALLMIEKRVETDGFGVKEWLEFVMSFENDEYTKSALQAFKKYHSELFKRIEIDRKKPKEEQDGLEFPRDDPILLEDFSSVDVVLYMLDLANNPMVDGPTQYEALIIGEKKFEEVLKDPKEREKYLDTLLSIVLTKIPEIRDATGMNRMTQAQFILEHSGIDGLKDVPLVVEKEVDGEKRTSWKPYMSASSFHPGKFVYGVARDFLEPLVSKQKDALLKEFEDRWTKEQAAKAAAAAAEKKAAEEAAKVEEAKEAKAEDKKEAKAEDKKEAKAEDKKAETPPVEKPDFTAAPEFIAELNKRVDQKVTPLVETWLTSPTRVKRIFGIAGLKYLATPKAQTLLSALAGDKTDISGYMGNGVTLAALALNASKGIELSSEFEQLKLDAIRDKILRPEEVERVRQRMMADMSLTGPELEKKYREEIEKRKQHYRKQKEKLAAIMKKYQKVVRWVCFGMIKVYPSADKSLELEKYIDLTAVACRKEAEKKLTKEKLDFFGFTPDIYRSAVILGIMKKEITRKYVLKTKARVYLRAAVGISMQNARVQKELKRVQGWKLDDRRLRPIIDNFVKAALETAEDDYKKPFEAGPGKAHPGLSPEQIAEYRQYIELPEEYALALVLAYMNNLEFAKEDPETKARIATSIFKEAALAAFDAKTYFGKEPELTDFLIENNDDLWYVFQDIAGLDEDRVKGRWGFSDEVFSHYAKVSKKIRATVDTALALAVTEQKISQKLADSYKKLYPAYEEVLDIATDQFEIIRKEKMAEQKAKEEAAAKKAEAKAEKKKPAEKKEEKPAEKKEEKPAEKKEEKPAEKKEEKPAEKKEEKSAQPAK